MEEFLKFLITPILSEPDKFKITVHPSQITIEVGPNDTGKIIGKQGSVINSIRTLFKTYCTNNQLNPVTLTLITPKKD